MIAILTLVFVVSGAAGLIYESIWSRYLSLLVGHSPYAQITVLVIFLGGILLGARLDVANGLGAAVGVLAAGFILLDHVGLPGTLATGAILNFIAALAVAIAVVWSGRLTRVEAPTDGGELAPADGQRVERAFVPVRLLLGVSFGTAVASFIYEIAWIRMLSLVLGSATHSFELMLSAFILGLALGAFWIRARADRVANPLGLLGAVQCVMGVLAVATLPLYMAS